MAVRPISPADVRAQFPTGTVLHNPVSGECAVAPIARRRGRSVTREVMRAAIIPPERRPGDVGGDVTAG